MQAALARVWPRFSYLSVVDAEAARRGAARAADGAIAHAAGRDAVATLLQVLIEHFLDDAGADAGEREACSSRRQLHVRDGGSGDSCACEQQ